MPTRFQTLPGHPFVADADRRDAAPPERLARPVPFRQPTPVEVPPGHVEEDEEPERWDGLS